MPYYSGHSATASRIAWRRFLQLVIFLLYVPSSCGFTLASFYFIFSLFSSFLRTLTATGGLTGHYIRGVIYSEALKNDFRYQS